MIRWKPLSWGGATVAAAGGAGRVKKKMRQQTLGCAVHKLRSFLFTERRPTPTENVARVRRGVCWAILQHTVYTLHIITAGVWLLQWGIKKRCVAHIVCYYNYACAVLWRSWTSRGLVSLTQHCADLIGQDGVGLVQPSASTQALFEAVEDGLIGEQHHQDPQGCRDRAGVKMLLHEHQEPIKTQRPHQLLTRSEDQGGAQNHQMSYSQYYF